MQNKDQQEFQKENQEELKKNESDITSEESTESSENNEDTTKSEIKELKEKIAYYEDLVKRQAADFDNFRKRNAEEKERIKDTSFDSVFLDFLPIFDNLERALEASQKEGVTIEPIVEGLSGIVQLFHSFLEKHQVEKLESIDKEFDPSMHEALFTQEGDYEKQTVVQEVEKAYKRKDKVIRTAKVAVGVPKSKENKENENK